MHQKTLSEGINFDRMPCVYWSDAMKMSLLQRRIIVHSILYYDCNESVISDKQFDALSRQLVDLMKQSPEEIERTQYCYCMCDFDGSTGFDLRDRLTQDDNEYLTALALRVLQSYKADCKRGGR